MDNRDERKMRDIAARIEKLKGKQDKVADKAKEPDSDFGSLMRDFSSEDFETDPGYQFRLGEGAKAIENSAAARGMQLSGAALKGLDRYTQDFASNEYGRAWDRDSLEKQRKYNFLSGQSAAGQNTGAALGSMGSNSANAISDLFTQGGNARAGGIIGSSNALSGAFGDIGSYLRMKDMLQSYRG